MERTKAIRSASCTEPDLGDVFPDYLDGLVSLDEARRIEKHLAVCARCREELNMWLLLSDGGFPASMRQKTKLKPSMHKA
jgi:anti-sigma factor RsiW